MNGYDLHRMRLNFRFENPDKCRSIHSELFMYIVDLRNRFGQKNKFGLPSLYTMELLGIGSKNTFYKTLNDLVDWGFIEYIQKSKNQNTATVISVCNTSADAKSKSALDTATIQQLYNTCVDGENINKQYNNKTIKQKSKKIIISSSLTAEEKEEMFVEFWKVYPNKQGKAKAEEWYLKNITEELHKKILKGVQAYKRTTEEKKSRKEFAPEYKHGSTFLNQRGREDFTDITEEESFREAYEKGDAKIYSGWCKTEIGESWSTNEEYYKPYNDLKSAILQKNNDRDGYDNFISCYQTKWKN